MIFWMAVIVGIVVGIYALINFFGNDEDSDDED